MTAREHFLAAVAGALQPGDGAAVHLSISEVELVDGTSISPPVGGVTAIVGPNNAGKSTLLRELHAALAANGPSSPGLVVNGLRTSKEGRADDVLSWLLEHNDPVILAPPERPTLTSRFGGQALNSDFLASALPVVWGSADGSLAWLRDFFVHFATAETRLQMSQAAPAREDARQPASHPLHVLEDDRGRLRELDVISRRVFDDPLQLDDYSSQRRLRVGPIASAVPLRDSADASYRDELLDLPELARQGDGMRSFFGQVLPLMTGAFPVVLIDEPEAFLHPPQAAQLGRELGALARRTGAQVLLATHDRNLLQGLLSSGTDLSVVRVDRRRGSALAHQLGADELAEIWATPALRYSNALDGLFHRVSVLVEGDSDARFYGATLDALEPGSTPPPDGGAPDGGGDDGGTGLPARLAASDVLFIPCNGKGGMARLAAALRGLGVAVVATPDLDVLKEVGQIRALVRAFGGDWGALSSGREAAVGTLERRAHRLTRADVERLLPEEATDALDESAREAIERLLHLTSGGWQEVKRGGTRAFGGGGAGAAALQLLDALDELGIVCNREGELESFNQGLGAGKQRWVEQALDAGVHRQPVVVDHALRLLRVGVGQRPSALDEPGG